MQLPHIDDLPIFREIHTQSDRGAAVIAAGFLEAKLTAALKACFRPDKDISNKLFKASGPVGAFASKIELGYLLRLYRKETRNDLLVISEIRNLFAHKHAPINFGTKEIREKCDQLTLMARAWSMFPDLHQPRPLNQQTARHEYLESISVALNFLDHQSKHAEFRARAEELLPY